MSLIGEFVAFLSDPDMPIVNAFLQPWAGRERIRESAVLPECELPAKLIIVISVCFALLLRRAS